MRRSLVTLAAAVVISAGLVGCSSSTPGTAEPTGKVGVPTASQAQPAGSAEPTEPTEPAEPARPDGGDAKAPDDVCAALPAAAVGGALGATVETEPIPGGGCTYKQEDPRAPRAGVSVLPDSDVINFDAYVNGTASAMKDPTRTDVPGVGSKAAVVAGESKAGGFNSAVGVADAGGMIIVVTTTGGPVDKLTSQATAVLTVAVAGLAG